MHGAARSRTEAHDHMIPTKADDARPPRPASSSRSKLDYVWPVVGFVAVGFSFWLLYRELRGSSVKDVWGTLAAIPSHRYGLALVATLAAYWALAWYDRIALEHLGRKLGWGFISVVSFTTFALSHNIGASVFSFEPELIHRLLHAPTGVVLLFERSRLATVLDRSQR